MCLHETVDPCFFYTTLFIIIILIRCISDTGNQCGWKSVVDCLKKCFIALRNERTGKAFVREMESEN